MDRVNVTINQTHRDLLNDIKTEADEDISDAEAARRLFECVNTLEQELNKREQELNTVEQELNTSRTEYEQEIADLENRIEDLQRQLAATNARVDEHKELVEYVSHERSISERRAQAGVLTRAKWWLVGMGD